MAAFNEDWGLREELGFLVERQEAERRSEREVAREHEEVATRSMRNWAELVPEPKFGTLDFKHFPYQLEWYSDEVAAAVEVAWQKSTQVGMSAYAWRWAARRADQFGDTVLYWFPTDRHVTEFGDERIEQSIDESEYLRDRIPAGYVRNKHQKRIGSGWLYLRGSVQTRMDRRTAAAQSVAGDAQVFDEYDDLEPRSVSQAERRLSGAKAAGRERRTRRLGVPSLPGWGIAGLFDRSDQRLWHVKCPECGDEQPLTWEQNVRWSVAASAEVMSAAFDDYVDEDDVVDAWRACRTCAASLEPAEGQEFGPVHRGRWIATCPEVRRIGYHVSRLIVPRTDLTDIVKNSRKTATFEVEAFWNNDLGLPYSPEENGLTEEEVRRAMSYGEPLSQGYRGLWPVVMGVDKAGAREDNVCIYEVPPEGPRKALWVGTVEDWSDLDPLMQDYNVTLASVDSMPDRKGARAFAGRFPGRVVLARYDDTNPDAPPVTIDEKNNLITVHRTEAIDGMMDAVRHGRSVPPSNPPMRYVEHMVAMKAKWQETPRGRKVRVYVTTGGKGDDYAHAEVWTLVGVEVLKLQRAIQEQQWADQQVVDDETTGVSSLHLDDYPEPDGEDSFGWEPGFKEEW